MVRSRPNAFVSLILLTLAAACAGGNEAVQPDPRLGQFPPALKILLEHAQTATQQGNLPEAEQLLTSALAAARELAVPALQSRSYIH